MKKILLLLFVINIVFAQKGIVKPISSTKFKINNKIINLKGKKFIVVSIKGRGGDKLFFAVNKKGKTDFFGEISSAGYGKKTPEGIFKIIQRKRYHMSTIYDSGTGINNMDYMLKITKDGIALHGGDVSENSMGCVHINEIDAPNLFKWSPINTTVVITKNSYMKYIK